MPQSHSEILLKTILKTRFPMLKIANNIRPTAHPNRYNTKGRGEYDRFGIDLELETPQAGPFGWSFGVTPSVNTDFDSSIGGEGFQLDGRGILFWQLDQYWTLGLGAQYWDRVDDIIIPWAGLIYRDDYWEW